MARKARPGDALVDNAADPEQVKSAKVTERLRDQQHANDMREFYALPVGRRILDWLFETTGLFHSSFDSDPLRMAKNEGQRNVGLIILADLTRSQPTAFAEMLTARAATQETP